MNYTKLYAKSKKAKDRRHVLKLQKYRIHRLKANRSKNKPAVYEKHGDIFNYEGQDFDD